MTDSTAHPVRVRFAPSPTGYLHIGGARTALFNWLFAKKHNGTFILRIEDTDRKRYVPDAEQDIKDSLHWLGLDWQEGPDVGGDYGPYHQSERSELYQKWADWLIEQGYAYRCNCTPERLKEVREQQEKTKQKHRGYDRHCRDLNLGADVGSHVVRFKMPVDGETIVEDMIRGPYSYQNSDLQDLVILKSDGLPTYHLANVVDDHFMQISHIMRADEWLATAPLHYRLYEAFGWEMPAIAHLPVILNPNGKGKLSKRSQAFQDGEKKIPVQVREYREDGFLPEAVVNFLTNVGWAFGDDEEVFGVEETLPRFELKAINPAGSRLPFEKLEWLNGVYIQEKLSVDELAGRLKPMLEKAGLPVDDHFLAQVTPMLQTRIKTLNEAVEWVDWFFKEDIQPKPDDLIKKKMDAATTIKALRAVYKALSEADDFSAEAQIALIRNLAKELGLKAGQVFEPVRVAVTGRTSSLPLNESMEIIGKQKSLERIQAAADILEMSDI